MDNQDCIPMLYTINGFLNSKIPHVRYLDDPPVIDILESIARHLLLLAVTRSWLCIQQVFPWVWRSGTRLTTDYGAKPSLQAGLELAGHQGIVSPSLCQDAEVQAEQAQVEDGGDQGQHAHHHRKVC